MTDIGVMTKDPSVQDGLLASGSEPMSAPRIMRTKLTAKVSASLHNPEKKIRCYPAQELGHLEDGELRALAVAGTALEPIVRVMNGQEVPKRPTFDYVMVTFGLPRGAIEYLLSSASSETITPAQLALRWDVLLGPSATKTN